MTYKQWATWALGSVSFIIIVFTSMFFAIKYLPKPKEPKIVIYECKLLERTVLSVPNPHRLTRVEHITVWDCGEYGILISNEELLFRWGKPISRLYINATWHRIVGIQ